MEKQRKLQMLHNYCMKYEKLIFILYVFLERKINKWLDHSLRQRLVREQFKSGKQGA